MLMLILLLVRCYIMIMNIKIVIRYIVIGFCIYFIYKGVVVINYCWCFFVINYVFILNKKILRSFLNSILKKIWCVNGLF